MASINEMAYDAATHRWERMSAVEKLVLLGETEDGQIALRTLERDWVEETAQRLLRDYEEDRGLR